MSGAEDTVVINQPGTQPGFKITLPNQSLLSLQPGRGIPFVQASHLLVKTDNGEYQILEVNESMNATAILTPTTTAGLNVNNPSPNSVETAGLSKVTLELLHAINNQTPTIGSGSIIQPQTSTENHLRSNSLGSNINLKESYDCIKAIRSSMLQLSLLIKRPDVSLAILKWAIQTSKGTISDLTRDVTVCLEILNQKQIHKIKRKKYMKNIKRTTSNDQTTTNLDTI